ncbi:MAG: hypothetical protein Q9O24_05610 [Gammaproteobacteria bacterium]|nr:hypothetical protein [Gammaproteobacteria bacterium]
MKLTLTVVVNGDAILDYDRNSVTIPPRQQEYLLSLDGKMSKGIELEGEFFRDPNTLQRGRFIANHMIQSLLYENDQIASACCAYLAERLPQLQQVIATENDKQVAIELVFDRPYQHQQEVQFVRPEQLN